MLRRKHKRHGDTEERKDVRTHCKKRAVLAAEEDEENVDETLENLVFGGEGSVLKELENDADLLGNKRSFQTQEVMMYILFRLFSFDSHPHTRSM